MPQSVSPVVVTIIAIAGIFILLKVARKLIFHWLLLLIILTAVFVVWPKGLEILGNLVMIIREIIFKK